jgi:methyl-accepting chemotaxis protein
MLNEMERNDAKAALRVFADRFARRCNTCWLSPTRWRSGSASNCNSRWQRHNKALSDGRSGWLCSHSAVALVALALAVRTIRSVVGPMAQLEAAARRIAAGHYTSAALEASTQEFERVGQALNAMAGTIAQREQEIERLAFRDPLNRLAQSHLPDSDMPKRRTDQRFSSHDRV